MARKKNFPIEQINRMIELYSHGFSLEHIGTIFGCSGANVAYHFRKHDIKIKNSSFYRKYKISHDYFDNIDCESKAYFLGLLYADGYNDEKHGVVNLSLIKSDKDILLKLNKAILSEKPLQEIIYKTNTKDMYRLVISSQKISKQLSKLGCMQNKSFKLTFPSFLDDNLIRHFIRGYFDGDGSINNKPNRPSCTFTGTNIFCDVLSEMLKNKFDIYTYKYIRHPERKNNIVTINFSGRGRVLNFLSWLYDDSYYYLNRKFNKYQNIKNYKIKQNKNHINIAKKNRTKK